MDVIYGLIPMVLIAGFFVVIAFIWMAKKGHFDDMDGQASRILMDDDFPEEIKPVHETKNDSEETDSDSDSAKNKNDNDKT